MKKLLIATMLLASCGGSGSDGAESYGEWAGSWKMNTDYAVDSSDCRGIEAGPRNGVKILGITQELSNITIDWETIKHTGTTLADNSIATTVFNKPLILDCRMSNLGIETGKITLTRISENDTLVEVSLDSGCKDARCHLHASGTATRQ